MDKKFRKLKASEIECRPQSMKASGFTLLLYKDARVDANILDETVGAMNWQRHHLRDNANCIVSIWDSEKSQWIEKEDTGSESNTEKEKGLASDSFKRACFQWGIGRELYTAPWIYIKSADAKIEKSDRGSYFTYDKFVVSNIEYKEESIEFVEIANKKTGKVVFTSGRPKKSADNMNEKISSKDVILLETLFDKKNLDWHTYIKTKDISELTKEEYGKMLVWLKKQEESK